jgi:putative Mn2+ efflux pump MntP
VSLRLVALVVPLALDTFAVCAALAAGGLSGRERRRIGAAVVLFEAGMPVVGLLLGRSAAHALGGPAEWVGLACLAAVGVWLLVERDEPRAAGELKLGALLLLGVAVSVDELALGFSFGLLRIAIGWAVALIAAQAVVASQLGFRLGGRAARTGELAERGAGLALLVAAALLLASRVF